MEKAEVILARLDTASAYGLTKAFSIYFELTNLAETMHRKRRRRALQLAATAVSQPGTLEGTLLRMRSAGIDEHALEHLSRVLVEPVFTAHP
jgi:phosphoenolpyruvate carboxylase